MSAAGRPGRAADRVAGSLLGLAIGDAVGAGVEGLPATEARRYVEVELRRGLAQGRPRPPHPFGQYTDDTIMARELVASATADGLDLDRFAMRLTRLAARGEILGIGPGSAAALRRVAAGTAWAEAGTPAPYAGNGAAMRVGPLGALFRGDVPRVRELAVAQGRVTHRDPRALAGAAVVGIAAATFDRLDRRHLHGWCEELALALHGVEGAAGFIEALGELPALARLPLMEAAAGVAEWAESAPEPGMGLAPFVVPTVLWSLLAALRSPDDLPEAVRVAIWIGGDTDTMAAMAGAIVGARVGTAGLPPDVVGCLTDRGAWTGADLLALARRA